MIQELIQGIKNCACGRDHYCPVEHIVIDADALAQLPGICRAYNRILLVCDDNTWAACARQVADMLADQLENRLILCSGEHVLVPNEQAIAQIEEMVTEQTELILGVGSGVINDLCKHVSFQHDLPYYIVATAPSMDGYVSVGAALILGGMKVTLNARPPKAVIADTGVLKNAPMPMLQAGYGDIIGKFSCLNDWKLSALIHGEYFCQRVYDMTMDCANKVSKMAKGILDREEATVKALMEALVIVGIAMSYVDCSRPASGSEHHLSHFFEITGILEGKEYFSHGIDVAYSAVLTARRREALLQAMPPRKVFDRASWEREIHRVYGASAEGVIALQNKLGWHERDDYPVIREKWEQIKGVLAQAPDSETFLKLVEAVGLRYAEFESMYGAQKLADAMEYAKDLKDRYTVLWL